MTNEERGAFLEEIKRKIELERQLKNNMDAELIAKFNEFLNDPEAQKTAAENFKKLNQRPSGVNPERTRLNDAFFNSLIIRPSIEKSSTSRSTSRLPDKLKKEYIRRLHDQIAKETSAKNFEEMEKMYDDELFKEIEKLNSEELTELIS